MFVFFTIWIHISIDIIYIYITTPIADTSHKHPNTFLKLKFPLRVNMLSQIKYSLLILMCFIIYHNSIKLFYLQKYEHKVQDPTEGDSDSAYSGDVSNTDSGRGPSEEGELLATGQIPHAGE